MSRVVSTLDSYSCSMYYACCAGAFLPPHLLDTTSTVTTEKFLARRVPGRVPGRVPEESWKSSLFSLASPR